MCLNVKLSLQSCLFVSRDAWYPVASVCAKHLCQQHLKFLTKDNFKRCWKLIDIKRKMSKETQMSMQMFLVYWIVLVKCCRCSHNLCWLQRLCPNLRTSTQHFGCKCLYPPCKHSAAIYARWYNDSALFCHSFLYFWSWFCTHQRVDSCFLLINLETRSECYFVCFFVCVVLFIGSEMHQIYLKAGFSH